MAERKTRDEWVAAAARALTEQGVDGVKIERLARTLGVTKGSFYWHFAHRRELLDAIVDHWMQEGTAAVIDRVEAGGGDEEDKLRRLWRIASGAGEQAFELALRDWARRDPNVAERIRTVDERRMAYLRRLLRQVDVPPATVEARCLLLYSLLIGDWFLDVEHGHKGRARVLREALDLLLGG
ncbi:MAG: TetR/AcrR family transcriptional regulator [Sandaracinaceae bacterium]